MRKLFILFFCLAWFLPCFAAGQEALWGNVLIGKSFKTLAKTYVNSSDFNKLKAYGAAELEKISDDKFNSLYVDYYRFLSKLPKNIKKRCAIKENTKRPEAIMVVNSLDKDELLSLIDDVPDSLAAEVFYDYLNQHKDEYKSMNLGGQISHIWERITQKAPGSGK